MEIIPIQTRILTPPKDDLFEVLDTHLTDVREGDVVIITSKVVSIDEGRCVAKATANKHLLVEKEAEYMRVDAETGKVITLAHNMLVGSAGIDESNGSEYYVLLPEDPFYSAQRIHAYLKKRHARTNLGVVITDSHSLPLRYGSLSASIGCWGFEPVVSHSGKKDLFGRVTKYAKSNVADALAASSALVSGECDESVPIVVARGVPSLHFTEENLRNNLFVSMEEDVFKVLFAQFIKKH